MATVTTPVAQRRSQTPPILPLENGDRLTRAEFERRYEAMTHVKKAELIDGVVYMPSPVSLEYHGSPHADMMTWLGVYRAAAPGVQVGDNSTVRLEGDNEPQPDGFLRLATPGGQSRIDEDGYVEGAPELMAEIAASSASYDLHDKLDVYRRHNVREYVVWRTYEEAVDWFVLRRGRYGRLPLTDGVYQSRVFPGLWLHPGALVRGDLATVLQVLHRGLASPEHAAFVARLRRATAPNGR